MHIYCNKLQNVEFLYVVYLLVKMKFSLLQEKKVKQQQQQIILAFICYFWWI